jgi:hypothetical protein
MKLAPKPTNYSHCHLIFLRYVSDPQVTLLPFIVEPIEARMCQVELLVHDISHLAGYIAST